MTLLSQIALEEAVSAEAKRSDAIDFSPDLSAEQRRYAALEMLSRRTLSSTGDKLLDEAAGLAAAALYMDHFAFAQKHPDRRVITVRFGTSQSGWSGDTINEITVPDDVEKSAFAYAMHVDHPVVVADLFNESRFNDEVLGKKGVKCGVICPLTFKGRTFGALSVFNALQQELSKEDVSFVNAAAQLVGPVATRDITEKALAQQANFLTATMDTMEGMVVLLSTDGRILRVNRACQRITGFNIQEVRQRHIWSTFLTPTDVGPVQKAFEELRKGESVAKSETDILTKHGDRRRVAWSFTTLKSASGEIQSFVGTGVDVTEHQETLKKLQRAESTAENAKLSFRELKKKLELSNKNQRAKSTPARGIGETLPRDERRQSSRREYFVVQHAAPMRNGRLPAMAEFKKITCHDISSTGFSFLCRENPKFDRLVVAFGANESSRIYITAEVVHTTPFNDEGREVQLVGCKYLGRAKY